MTAAGRARRDLPALLDAARDRLAGDAPAAIAVPAGLAPATPPLRIEQLVAGRHIRVLPGTRLAADEFTDAGLVVVGADDLADTDRIDRRRVDAVAFAASHPSAQLTLPGDVVFRTGPTVEAWVDAEGSKIVAYPARVLRIDAERPGGLVPQLVATDIRGSVGGPGSWRRWVLRRVASDEVVPLRAALVEITTRRDNLLRRAAALDDYAGLLGAGLVSGAMTLTPTPTDRPSSTDD